MNNQLTPIPFHGDTIFLLDHEGQPYTPVKPISENMGLDWKSQHRKLMSKEERWGVVTMTIPSPGGKQEMTCFPLRKLTAFLYSVSASKVKPEIKKKVELYQAECDDVLWDYWTKGQATNPRMSDQVEGSTVPTDKYIALMEKYTARLEADLIEKPRRIRRSLSPEKITEIRRLDKTGMKAYDIGEQIGRHRSTVNNVLAGIVAKGGAA